MKRLLLATVIVCSASAMSLDAQQPRMQRGAPGQMPGPGAMGQRGGSAADNPAEYLLAHTGEFGLTDAQVTRLAGIARRSAERRRSMRVRLDSLRPDRGTRPDSATRDRMRQRFEQMRPQMDRMREQSLADRRDAIAVLTPDQQAQAWERIARSARSGPGGFNRGGRGGMSRGGFRGRPMPGGPMGGQGVGPRRPDDGGTPGERQRRPRPRPGGEG